MAVQAHRLAVTVIAAALFLTGGVSLDGARALRISAQAGGEDLPSERSGSRQQTQPSLETAQKVDSALDKSTALVPFAFNDVVKKAKALADAPYKEPQKKAPAAAAKLDYDQYRRIEFKREAADWSNSPDSLFRIHYETEGFLFTTPVAINIVDNGRVTPRPYRADDFRFFDLPLTDADKNALDIAGFHLTTPMNVGGKFDDLINFKGASFFRVLSAGTNYGASARGLALSTASPSGEEFPYFKEFWIVHPQAEQSNIVIYALMDSRRASGAFKFTVTPGVQTIVDVDATIFPRTDLTEVGIAPLSSMFDFAPHDPAPKKQDYRPAVHDSEGLMIEQKNGEWVWRPLINPKQLEISSFAHEPPAGFGLIQRDRDPNSYQDFEANYDKRPSIWITPKSDWGSGELILVEIPTENEFNDNIVTFWRPKDAWKKGAPVKIAYRMYWGLTTPAQPTVARIKATRTGVDINSGERLFVIDFDTHDTGLADGAVPKVTTTAGAIKNVQIAKNPVTEGLRLTFGLDTDGVDLAELRAYLTNGADKQISETWLYRWRPE